MRRTYVLLVLSLAISALFSSGASAAGMEEGQPLWSGGATVGWVK